MLVTLIPAYITIYISTYSILAKEVLEVLAARVLAAGVLVSGVQHSVQRSVQHSIQSHATATIPVQIRQSKDTKL